MIGFLSNVLNLLRSKGFREDARSFSDFLRKSPDWQRDVAWISASIKKVDREFAQVFATEIDKKLNADGNYFSLRENFLPVFYELVDNGFSHGCPSDQDSITIVVCLFVAGITLEVVNDNKSIKIPSLDIIKNKEYLGLRGNGIKSVLSIAKHHNFTNDDRGIKVAMYEDFRFRDLNAEDVTFVQVQGFTFDVSYQIEMALRGKSGDVIVVTGRHIPASVCVLAATEIDRIEFDGRFAIVVERESEKQHVAAILNNKSDRLIGCFLSPEEALQAMRPLAMTLTPPSCVTGIPRTPNKRRRARNTPKIL